MKKLLTAVFAVLMLAGALCAISGATPMGSVQSITIVGEGTSPIPILLSSGQSPAAHAAANQF